MARIKQALASHLINSPTVFAIVEGRVYRGLAPPGTPLPRLVLHQLNGIAVRHFTAASGLKQAFFQIDCWASSEDDADKLADAVRDALDHYQGDLGIGKYIVSTNAVFISGPRDEFEIPRDAGAVRLWREILEAEIWHRESLPALN